MSHSDRVGLPSRSLLVGVDVILNFGLLDSCAGSHHICALPCQNGLLEDAPDRLRVGGGGAELPAAVSGAEDGAGCERGPGDSAAAGLDLGVCRQRMAGPALCREQLHPVATGRALTVVGRSVAVCLEG